MCRLSIAFHSYENMVCGVRKKKHHKFQIYDVMSSSELRVGGFTIHRLKQPPCGERRKNTRL